MRSKALPAEVDSAEQWLGVHLLGSAFETAPPSEKSRLLRQKIERLTSRAVEALSLLEPPIDPVPIGEYITGSRFTVEERHISSSHVGQLVPIPDGFRIIVNPDLSQHRRRFTVAHEIGHAMFYDSRSTPPSLRFRSSRYWVQEGYASQIARCILLPSPLLETKKISRMQPSLGTMLDISKGFDVSLDVVRRRILDDLAEWDCLIFTSWIQGQEIETLGTNISKGSSFRRLTIPRRMGTHSPAKMSEIRAGLISADRTGRFVGPVFFGHDQKWMESAVFARDSGAHVLSIVTKGSGIKAAPGVAG